MLEAYFPYLEKQAFTPQNVTFYTPKDKLSLNRISPKLTKFSINDYLSRHYIVYYFFVFSGKRVIKVREKYKNDSKS